MSVAEKLTTIAENVPKVFEAGKEAEHTTFWESYLKTAYMAYRFAGNGWNDTTFAPTKNIKSGTASANGMFRESKIVNLKQCLESCGVSMDVSKANNVSNLLGYCDVLEVVPKIDISSASDKTTYLFANDSKLRIIEELVVSETVTFASNSFNKCSALTHLIMTGTLATNGLDLSGSPNLDEESLASIVNVLQDRVSAGLSGTNTISLNAQSESKISDADKAKISQKGWSVTYK